jgi:hypothetical protein
MQSSLPFQSLFLPIPAKPVAKLVRCHETLLSVFIGFHQCLIPIPALEIVPTLRARRTLRLNEMRGFEYHPSHYQPIAGPVRFYFAPADFAPDRLLTKAVIRDHICDAFQGKCLGLSHGFAVVRVSVIVTREV